MMELNDLIDEYIEIEDVLNGPTAIPYGHFSRLHDMLLIKLEIIDELTNGKAGEAIEKRRKKLNGRVVE